MKEFVELLREQEEFTEEDAEEVRALLGNVSLLRFLGMLQQEADSYNSLSNVSLLTTEGVVEASQRKGHAEGISSVLAQCQELLSEEEDGNTE